MSARAGYLFDLFAPAAVGLCLLLLAQAVTTGLADSLAVVGGVLNPAPPSASSPGFLADIYFDLARVVAGMLGGFLFMTQDAAKGATFGQWALRVAAGGVMGNYLPPFLLAVPGVGDALALIPTPPLACACGVIGFALFRRLTSKVKLS